MPRTASRPPGATAIPAAGATRTGRTPRKIGALGLRIERGVSYHGIALNVSVDLADFDLIDPCGMPGVASTSIAAERGETTARTHDGIGRARRRHLRRRIRRRTRRAADRDLTMAAGLFELRKDPITGWWVATVVDRAFHRDRFARAAEPIDDRLFGCANCSTPEGDGVRVRMLKDFAFHVVGTDDDARELNSGLAQVALAQARATGSWRTIVAPPGEHRPLHAVGTEMIEALVGNARGGARRGAQPARPTTSRSSRTGVHRPAPGPTTSASTCMTCPRSRTGSPRRWAAQPASSSARASARSAASSATKSRLPDRLVWEDDASVAFAPYASRSSFEVWIVPRRHEADFGRATRPDVAATAEALRQVLARLAASLDGPPYNLVLHTAPLREQVDATYHWHWEIHPRLREIAGLELGTGLPVNPVSPEDAVEELLGRAEPDVDGTG